MFHYPSLAAEALVFYLLVYAVQETFYAVGVIGGFSMQNFFVLFQLIEKNFQLGHPVHPVHGRGW